MDDEAQQTRDGIDYSVKITKEMAMNDTGEYVIKNHKNDNEMP